MTIHVNDRLILITAQNCSGVEPGPPATPPTNAGSCNKGRASAHALISDLLINVSRGSGGEDFDILGRFSRLVARDITSHQIF